MKLNIIILTLFFAVSLQAQDHSSIMAAVGSGNADQVAAHMDNNIEVCFNDKVEFMTKPQAKKALANFYANNPPKSFDALHKGNSKGADSKYMIANYTAKNGSTYRVYVFAKEVGTTTKIQEIRFDPQ